MDLELIGVVLYKCEGTKLRRDSRYKNTYYYATEFTNSDPVLVKLFLRFLREVVLIDEKRLKCELFLYEDQDKENIKEKWSKVTGLSLNSFNRTIVFKTKVSKFKPNPLGTCKIRYVDKNAYLRLNSVIQK